MRRCQIPQLFQVAHLIADGRRGKTHALLAGDRAGADGHSRCDVVIDNGLKDFILPFVQIHAPSDSFLPFGLPVSTLISRVLTYDASIAPTAKLVNTFMEKNLRIFLQPFAVSQFA